MANTIDAIAARENTPGTIEYVRKMLGFLKTIERPSLTVLEMIRRYEAEIAAVDYSERLTAQQKVAGS